jgi:hypothetical protein
MTKPLRQTKPITLREAARRVMIKWLADVERNYPGTVTPKVREAFAFLWEKDGDDRG